MLTAIGSPRFQLWSARILALGAASLVLAGCSFGSFKFRSAQTQTVSVPAPATRLVIRNLVGDVTVTADSDATAVTAEIEKIGKGASQPAADKALSEIIVTFGPAAADPSVIEGVVSTPKSFGRSTAVVNWTITAPPGISLDVRTDVGNVAATGFTAGATLASDVGNIDGLSLTGAVKATANVGNVSLSVAGPVTAESDVGNVTVTLTGEQDDSVTLGSDVGDVTLLIAPSWRGAVHASSGVGSARLNGPTDLLRQVNQQKRSVDAVVADSDETRGGATATLATNVGDASVTIISGAPAPVATERQH